MTSIVAWCLKILMLSISVHLTEWDINWKVLSQLGKGKKKKRTGRWDRTAIGTYLVGSTCANAIRKAAAQLQETI